MKKLNIALVGLGFGASFTKIYQHHPDVESLTLCDADPDRLKEKSELLGVTKTAAALDEVLRDPNIDAVHLNSGIPDHARQSVQILKAGKHCACTVPMATSIEDIRAIIAATRESGKNYMLMETQLYAREFLHLLELKEQNIFGRVQFLRGAHYQDMEGWPPYWLGLPPMWYATHAISPLLRFAGVRARSVNCLGSGFMREEYRQRYNNPFPIETAIFELDRELPLSMEISRSLFHCARGYVESFSVYGEDTSFEYGRFHHEPITLIRQTKIEESPGKPRHATMEEIGLPDFANRLPAEIAHFTEGVPLDGRGAHPSIKHGGSHGGSHPHLVHEFVRSIIENRKPAIDEIHAATFCAPGICAHESAMQHGAKVDIPSFD